MYLKYKYFCSFHWYSLLLLSSFNSIVQKNQDIVHQQSRGRFSSRVTLTGAGRRDSNQVGGSDGPLC